MVREVDVPVKYLPQHRDVINAASDHVSWTEYFSNIKLYESGQDRKWWTHFYCPPFSI